MSRKILANYQIKAEKVRLINEEGKQLGVFSLAEALKMAQEKNLDLIQVTEKIDPPVCKIGDLGKYLYQLQKKSKKTKKGVGELKSVRISFNISEHDLKIRAQQIEKFLKNGYKVRIEMPLRGREKALEHFAKEKIEKFLKNLSEKIKIQIERDLKKEMRGFTVIISKGK